MSENSILYIQTQHIPKTRVGPTRLSQLKNDLIQPQPEGILALNRLQSILRFSGASRFALDYVTDNTSAASSYDTQGTYRPILTFWPGTRQVSIVGDFKVLHEFTSYDSYENNSSTPNEPNDTEDEDPLNYTDASSHYQRSQRRQHRTFLTNLPYIGRADQTTTSAFSHVIHDCLTWIDSNSNKQLTGSAVYTRNANETCGELYFFSPDGLSIPANATVHIDATLTNATSWGGDFNFPRITEQNIDDAIAWIKEHQGQFSYSNTLINRNNAEDSLSTDSSGLIYNAFKYGAGVSVPNSATAMGGFGSIVTYAKASESLKTNLLQKGDIVLYIRPDNSYAHHVSICVDVDAGEPKLWHMNTDYGLQVVEGEEVDVSLGPQPVYGRYNGTIITDETFGKTNFRLVVRWKNEYSSLFNFKDVMLQPEVSEDEPSEEITAGQILVSDGAGGGAWVDISIEDLHGVIDDISLYAPLNSPNFVGTPQAPTAPVGTVNDQIATTSFVANAISSARPASNQMPEMDGEGTPGVSTAYARADHRHPANVYKLSVEATLTNIEIENLLV